MRRVAEWVVQAERVALRRRTPLVNGERGKLVIGLRGVELRRLNELGDGLLAEGREAAELATLLVALLEGYHLVLPETRRGVICEICGASCCHTRGGSQRHSARRAADGCCREGAVPLGWVVQAERVALRRRTPLVNGE